VLLRMWIIAAEKETAANHMVGKPTPLPLAGADPVAISIGPGRLIRTSVPHPLAQRVVGGRQDVHLWRVRAAGGGVLAVRPRAAVLLKAMQPYGPAPCGA
jgi:hypothetical protein